MLLARVGRVLGRGLKPRNVALAVVVAGGGVVGQAAYLLSSYKPLPPPIKEGLRGVERWVEERDGRVPVWVRGMVRRMSERRRDIEGVAAQSGGADGDKEGGGGWMQRFVFGGGGGDRGRQEKRIVIIGDSLVVGIGCKEAPVMPKAICGRLAELLRVDVQWRALGVDGGDVRTIHRKVLAAVDDAVHAPANNASLSRGSAPVDAVIILCGLNDLKRLWMGRTSSVFRRDLDSFLVELRAKVGDECIIVLPAIPMEETLLPEPLRTVGIYVGQLFDFQKKDYAASEKLTHFIPKPAMEIWARAKTKGIIVAEDGVHPNERGYNVFGEYLAHHMADIMQSPQDLAVQASSLAFSAAVPAVSVDLPEQ